MTTFSMHNFMQALGGVRARLRDAFAIPRDADPLLPDDLLLLERVAEAVVRRGMAAPAVVFLESMAPMNFLGSQAVHFFTPLLEVVFPHRDVERAALLLERRDTLARLAALIENRADAQQTARAGDR
jgi:hypothetical protein